MRLFCITLLILSQAAAPMAQAGAWLRESGTGFVSLSFGATQFSETTNAAYIEYGLSDATTIGLDISSFTNSQKVRNGFGNLFVRRAFGPTNGASRMSYEIGIGGLWGNEMRRPTLKAGLSWGRGFEVGQRAGWVNLDSAYILEPTLGENITKFDGTFGMELSDITTGLVEVTLSHQNSATYGAVEPSVLFRPKGSQFNIKVGAQIPFDEQEKSALKLGIWHHF